jgi:hypothetical protein
MQVDWNDVRLREPWAGVGGGIASAQVLAVSHNATHNVNVSCSNVKKCYALVAVARVRGYVKSRGFLKRL